MKLQCTCGKILNVPESMSGERIRCKACGKVLTINLIAPEVVKAPPKKPDPTDPLAVRGIRHCPKCNRSWPTRDRICTACGIDMETGAALYVSLDNSAEAQAPSAQKTGIVGRFLRLIGRKGH